MSVARKFPLYRAWRKPITMAPSSLSGGSRVPFWDGGFHQSNAPITAKLLKALIQNGAAMPSPPMTTPPSAGPIARLILTPTPLLATAAAKSCFGTS